MKIKCLLSIFLLANFFTCFGMSKLYKSRVRPFSSMYPFAMQNEFYKFIDQSEEKLLVAIFTFCDKQAARKLVLAQARGVDVRIVMQQPVNTSPVLRMLKSFKIPTAVFKSNSAGAIMHNKYMVSDGKRVWLGSMNFTDPAYKINFESAVTLHSYALAQYFSKDFKVIEQRIRQQQKAEQVRINQFRANMRKERDRCMRMVLAYRLLQKEKLKK